MRGLQTTVSVLAAVLLCGCGSSYTKADFVARANAICTTAIRQARAVTPPALAGSRVQQLHALGAYAGTVLPIAASEAAQLRALKRPSQTPRQLAALERYLTSLTQAVSAYRTLAAAARAGDLVGVDAASAELRASQVALLATRYGLRSCGNPGSTRV